MKLQLILLVVLVPLITAAPQGKRRSRITTESLVESHGYPFEEHSVQTSDGYVLTIHRIPYSARYGSPDDGPRPVAFLMHGILCSSSDWVILGPGNGLAYLLSDAGYDVWMGNARGNTYSREHVTLNPFFGKFWSFDWHEIGLYDLPAMIDYIRFETDEDKVTYLGHSQGTTTFLLLNSLNERFKTRIKSAHLLAPVAFMENMESPLMDLTSLMLGPASKIPELFGNLEFLPSSKVLSILGQKSCADSSPIQGICSNVLFLIAGHDAENLNTSDEDVLELDHLKHDEPSTMVDESDEGGDIHFEIPSVGGGVVVGAERPVASAAEDTPINPTDLLPELEQQLEEMTTAKTNAINNAPGQREGDETPEGVSHHRPPMLPHHDGGKVGNTQQQPQSAGGINEESNGGGEGNANSPILTKPFYGAARLAFGQNPEVPSTTSTTTTSTTTAVPTTITSATTNENIPESIITSPPSAQSIETSAVLPPADSNKEQVNPPTSTNIEENNSNLSPSSMSSSLSANSNEKEQLGDTFIPQMEATKPGPERRSLTVMPLKTAENLLKHKDGQYSSFDMAQYVFWTGDEAGVARAVEEFIEQGLMSRENAIKFLRDIRLGIEYLQSSYANRVFPDQLRDNFVKKQSHNTNAIPTQAPTTKISTTTTTTTTRTPLSTTTERTRTHASREYSAAAGTATTGHGQMVLNQHLDKTLESVPSLMRLQDVNNVHHEREHSEYDEAAGRAKIAKFLYTEFSLEEVIYQLGKVMFSQSLAHGSDEAQQALQRLTDFLEEEGKHGMISPELQKKVLDVLLQALSDTLVEHPELLAAARANLGSSFEKIPINSLESAKNLK